MEGFSVLNVFILSTPQYFLCFMFSLIILGESNAVPFKCDSSKFIANFVKMLVSAVVVSFISAIVGYFIPNMNITSIVSMVVYSIILKYIYKTTWLKSILGVAAFSLLIISFESLYVPLCIRYFYNGQEANLLNSPELKRFLCFLPERLIQIVAIASFWNFTFVIQKFKQYKIRLFGFITVIFILFFIEVNLTKIYITYFTSFDYTTKIFLGLCCFGSGLLNFVILYNYIKVITSVSKFHLERSK
ncbi:hypothetical protein CLHUN_01510 [Ruminiclostridium hungatei]|uniref:Uncharacterized protein n=1 Tax=Ruminiclostridium hungatei TaxID=48256 RepID=A0A1V4SSB0_RUMHU|nr:hypothetical protein [Ruminiclostridium hungatei]OPX46335.1 hypothetical protein CLHUN_01510 [Ruminiclostridium hungatei]